jgi:hypothetical protein
MRSKTPRQSQSAKAVLATAKTAEQVLTLLSKDLEGPDGAHPALILLFITNARFSAGGPHEPPDASSDCA